MSEDEEEILEEEKESQQGIPLEPIKVEIINQPKKEKTVHDTQDDSLYDELLMSLEDIEAFEKDGDTPSK